MGKLIIPGAGRRYSPTLYTAAAPETVGKKKKRGVEGSAPITSADDGKYTREEVRDGEEAFAADAVGFKILVRKVGMCVT